MNTNNSTGFELGYAKKITYYYRQRFNIFHTLK